MTPDATSQAREPSGVRATRKERRPRTKGARRRFACQRPRSAPRSLRTQVRTQKFLPLRPTNSWTNLLQLDSLHCFRGDTVPFRACGESKNGSSLNARGELSRCHLPFYTVDAFPAYAHGASDLRDVLAFRAQSNNRSAVNPGSGALITSFLLCRPPPRMTARLLLSDNAYGSFNLEPVLHRKQDQENQGGAYRELRNRLNKRHA